MCYGTMSNVIYERQTDKSNAQDLSDSRLINFVIISMSVVSNIHELTIQQIIIIKMLFT